jgi:hypothetical protein
MPSSRIKNSTVAVVVIGLGAALIVTFILLQL